MSQLLNATERHTPGMIEVIGNAVVARLNETLRDTFDVLAAHYLSHEPESQLAKRLRKYDNYQRLAFGRASSTLVMQRDRIGDVEFKDLAAIAGETQDPCRFPEGLTSSLRKVFDELLNYSIRTLIPESTNMAEETVVSLFCNRTLVGPQEQYVGFFHRDLAPQGDLHPRKGCVGTMVWYPEVRDTLIKGAEFMAYEAHQDVQLQVLRQHEPDYIVEPAQYGRRAIALGYPHNYAHGVQPGRNPARRSRYTGSASFGEFINPPDDYFLKDMAIIVISSFNPIAT